MTLRPSRAAQQPCLSLCHLRTYVLSALFSEVESDHLRENTRLCCPFSHPHGGDRMGSVSLFQLSMSKQGRHLCFHFYGPGLIWKPWLACALTGGGLDLEFPWMVMLPGKKFSLYLENFHLGPTYHSVPVDTDFWFCPAAVRSYSLASWLFLFFSERTTFLKYFRVLQEGFLAGCRFLSYWCPGLAGVLLSLKMFLFLPC